MLPAFALGLEWFLLIWLIFGMRARWATLAFLLVVALLASTRLSHIPIMREPAVPPLQYVGWASILFLYCWALVKLCLRLRNRTLPRW